jgi:hypothetical protein
MYFGLQHGWRSGMRVGRGKETKTERDAFKVESGNKADVSSKEFRETDGDGRQEGVIMGETLDKFREKEKEEQGQAEGTKTVPWS